MAAARRDALESVDGELQALVERFEELPQGSIVVSTDQFATAVSDAEIFERIGEMAGIGIELEALDVNDRGVIGGQLRTKMAKRVARVEELLEACEELALFDPTGPAGELRTVAAESGHYGARLTQAFVAILVAETIPTARAAEAEMQGLLDGFPYKGQIDELLIEMRDWMVPDFDARAALVLGKPGHYSDEYGFLDIGAVFGAFADDGKPLAELARCGRRYFSHLIGTGPVLEEALESYLVVPAIGLATLDRPLVAHRIARSTHELLEEASQTAPAEAQRLIERTTGEGELIFEALEQIRRGVILLDAGMAAGAADDGAVLKTVMEAYKELAETSFRTYGRLILDLERLKHGKAPSEGTDPPMLGNLSEALEASSEPAAKGLAASNDTALRNACSHSQYHWDEEAEEVVDMRTAQRWSLEELDARVAAMGAAIAGADAGYSCFLTSGTTRVELPSWVRGGTGSLSAIVAKANFSARGFRVVEVGDRGLTVTIEDGGEVDKMSLMSTLGGVTVFADSDQAVRVLGRSGRILLDVEVGAFRQASEAKEDFKDLAILIPFFSNAMRTEGDQEKSLRDWVTVMANQVLVTAPVDVGAPAMLTAADRFGYVVEFARGQDIEAGKELSRLLKAVSRCRALAFAAARGDTDAAARFAEEMLALNERIVNSGVSWPPS
jgi:hypothetical protein